MGGWQSDVVACPRPSRLRFAPHLRIRATGGAFRVVILGREAKRSRPEDPCLNGNKARSDAERAPFARRLARLHLSGINPRVCAFAHVPASPWDDEGYWLDLILAINSLKRMDQVDDLSVEHHLKR